MRQKDFHWQLQSEELDDETDEDETDEDETDEDETDEDIEIETEWINDDISTLEARLETVIEDIEDRIDAIEIRIPSYILWLNVHRGDECKVEYKEKMEKLEGKKRRLSKLRELLDLSRSAQDRLGLTDEQEELRLST